MFFVKKNDEVKYDAPLDLLQNMPVFDDIKEVMYTFGSQEIVKDIDKYYIADVYTNQKLKEISRQAAYEMIEDIKLGDIVNNKRMYRD